MELERVCMRVRGTREGMCESPWRGYVWESVERVCVRVRGTREGMCESPWN